MLLIVRWGNMQLNMAFERFTKQLKSDIWTRPH